VFAPSIQSTFVLKVIPCAKTRVLQCKPTIAHFNIVQRVTAGLSFLHKELLSKRKLIELKEQTPFAWKTTHSVLLQEVKTAVWQQSCEIPKSSNNWNIKDTGHAGTSRHHSETFDDIPGK
jgi:hypothetical protein